MVPRTEFFIDDGNSPKKNEKKYTRVINAYVLKSSDNTKAQENENCQRKGTALLRMNGGLLCERSSLIGNNSTTLPRLDLSGVNEGGASKGRNGYWNTINTVNRSADVSYKKDLVYTMKTLSVNNNNCTNRSCSNKTKLLLPRKIKPPLNEHHTRRFLTNEIDGFYDDSIHKNAMVFNLTSKNLYKKAPHYAREHEPSS